MAKLVSTTYSDALFELALDKGALDSYAEEMHFVKESIDMNVEFGKLLNHPKITIEEKSTIIESVFKGKVSDDVTGFLVLIVEKGRTSELMAIIGDFLMKVKEHNKVGTAYVTSAVGLSGPQKDKLTAKLLQTTRYKSFEMEYDVDPSLIGGLVVRIKDRVVDNSIKTKLYLMSNKLSKIHLAG